MSSTTVQLTVGKVDAGVAILLTPDHHLLEFPALLLPSDIEAGSLVDISVTRNRKAEEANHHAFQELQDAIFEEFGQTESKAPILSILEVTPTRLQLIWEHGVTHDPIQLHVMLNNQSVHTLPFTPSYPFASIPIQGEYILDQLVPGTPYKVHLQFTTEMDRLIKSNVVETCTIGPFLDPSSIPLPDSPKPSNTTGSSPNESVVMMAQLDHAFSESSLESLDLSDASHSPLPHSIYQTHNEETDLSSPEEIPVVDSEGDATH